MDNENIENSLRLKISNLVKEFSNEKFKKQDFVPGETIIPPSGKLLGNEEIQNMVSASLDAWLTTGRFNDQFEQKLAKFFLLLSTF